METSKSDTNNLKPLDWEKAVAGEPVVDRAGRPVTQITRFNGVKTGRCVAGVDCDGDLNHYHEDGHFPGDKEDCILDLFMAPTEKTVWVNHCHDLHATCGVLSFTYASEEDADRALDLPLRGYLGRTTFTYTV